MSMTIVVTRNVSPRVRGFLASVMLEVAPGVYTTSKMAPPVRDRVWSAIEEWFAREQDASVVMLWQDRALSGGQGIRCLGSPPIELVDADTLILARRPATEKAL